MSQTKPLAVITGAARRIGAEMARQFHQRDHNIALHFNHSKNEAKELADKLNSLRPDSCRIYQADLDKLDEVHSFCQQVRDDWQRCDVLINNASTFYPTPIGTIEAEHWHNLISSNVQAPLFISQAFADLLKQSRGSIINLSDINALKPAKEHTVYCIAKAGNNMLTLSLAKELAPEVRVNGIAPGSAMWPENANKEEIVSPEKLQAIPLQRLGGAESIVKTAIFLALDNDYISGQIISVDGGKSIV